MPLACPRCNSPYQEGQAFCQRCGAPLTGAQPQPGATPPESAAPPTAPQPPYGAPPYGYAPQHYGAPPPHRLPSATILGMVIGLLGVVAAIAILMSNHGSNPQPNVALGTATAAPTQAGPTQAVPTQPVPTQPGPTQAVPTQPGPTEAVPTQPEPTQAAPSPAPQPTSPPSPNGQPLTTSTFSLTVPSGWQVANSKTGSTGNEVQLEETSTEPNLVDIFGGQVTSAQTAQAVLQSVLTNLQQQYADAKVCSNNVQQATIGGVSGSAEVICFTFTPQGGAAISSGDLVWGGTSPSGMSVYIVQEMGGASNQTFFTDASTMIGTLQWVVGQ